MIQSQCNKINFKHNNKSLVIFIKNSNASLGAMDMQLCQYIFNKLAQIPESTDY
jgi:hypothetical protein